MVTVKYKDLSDAFDWVSSGAFSDEKIEAFWRDSTLDET